jgi:hypothetical protein
VPFILPCRLDETSHAVGLRLNHRALEAIAGLVVETIALLRLVCEGIPLTVHHFRCRNFMVAEQVKLRGPATLGAAAHL